MTDTISWDFDTDSPTSYSTPANVTVNTQYDNAFRPTSITWNPSGSKSYQYNDAAMSVSLTINTGAGSGQWSQNFDGWGRVVTTIDQGGGQVLTTYDPFGRLASKTNPLPSGTASGPTTSYQYDPLGRLITTTLPDGSTISTTYSGGIVTATDEVGRTQRQFDGLGRLIAVTEQDPTSGSLTQTTNYSYDLLNNLAQVNQGGQIRSWKWDAMGRLLYENIPEQTATINDGTGTMRSCKWTYNDFGLVTTKTDARGVLVFYGYDGLNHLTSITYNTTSAPGVAATLPVGLSYDSAGRIISGTVGTAPVPCPPPQTNCSGGGGADFYYAESYTYDSSGNPGLTSLTRTTDTLNPANGTLVSGQSYTTAYANDSFRKPISITYPSGRAISYNRQSTAIRLASITDQNTTYLNNISYNPAGQVWQFYLGNGVIEGLIYDGASPGATGNRLQMTALVLTSPGGAPGNLGVLSYGYQASAGQLGTGTTAGNTGQLMSVSGTLGGQTESAAYTYDLESRLVTSSQTSNGASSNRRFAYDRWGNRTGVWDAVSGGNQLQSLTLQQSGGAPTNRIATVNGTINYTYDSAGNLTNDGAHSYTYDAENRLVAVDGGATAKYYYDFQNRRVMKVSGGVTTHYVWEGGKVLSEHNGSNGSVLVDYIYGGSTLIAKVASGITSYFLSDRLSIRVSLDSSGNVIGREAHGPFGGEFGESGQQEKHHFTNYESDPETGVDYAVNRFYAVSVGRFMSADPYKQSGYLVDPQSWNRYSYAGGDPTNTVDPVGLDGQGLLATAIDNLNWYSIFYWNLLKGPGAPGRHDPLLDTGDNGGGGGEDPDSRACQEAIAARAPALLKFEAADRKFFADLKATAHMGRQDGAYDPWNLGFKGARGTAEQTGTVDSGTFTRLADLLGGIMQSAAKQNKNVAGRMDLLIGDGDKVKDAISALILADINAAHACEKFDEWMKGINQDLQTLGADRDLFAAFLTELDPILQKIADDAIPHH
jgi:RHS repeat-associated protein